MPRKPRFVLPGVPVHVVQRGHNRDDVFFADEDRDVYLRFLGEAARRNRCSIHAYALMTNHIHLLVTPKSVEGVSRLMQYVGQHYVPYINRTYEMSGSLWEGRYKAHLVDAEDYLLTCMRYIELNPVRAKLARGPAQYRWSSYRSNAQGRADPLITPHLVYESLAGRPGNRQTAYRALFKSRLSQTEMDQINAAWQTGTPLGSERFLDKVERKLKQSVGYAKRGRPQKLVDS